LLGMVTASICALLSLPAAGSEPRWQRIASPNFELFTTAGERSGRDVARHFEQVRSFFLEAMGLGRRSGPPVRIVVFRSDKDFAPYAPNEFAAAFYLGTDERDYIIMKSASSEHFPIAVHEYTHLLVKHSGVRVPVWFNEGLAELYSNLKQSGDKVEVGDLIMPHFVLLRQSKWIDLQTLLAAGHDSPLYNEKSHAGLFYAECWALVHMLYLGKDYRPHLSALLDGIKSGADMNDTFRKAYSKTVEQVQADLQAYMRSSSFNASIFHTKLAKAAEAPEVTDTNPLETGLVLAEILANTRSKAAEGREAYVRLAREYPKDWRVQEGLARLCRRERKHDEAMQHYARAVELGSTNPKLYLNYGRMLRVADERRKAVDVLKRAAELDPENQETVLELGFAFVVNDQFAEALTQLKLVKHVPPERAFGYFHAMAFSYYRLERKAEAAMAANACRKYAKTPEEIEQLDHLVDALNHLPRSTGGS
jgi:tetratricopeptide (TPR) repeat protein